MEYKYIPRHFHIFSFDILQTRELNSELLFCVSFCKGKIRHFVMNCIRVNVYGPTI